MDKKTTQLKILKIISDSKLAIIDFQNELLDLNSFLDLTNPKEKEIMISMTEDINFILTTININCIKLDSLMKNLEHIDQYFTENEKNINQLLTTIEDFNNKIIFK